MKVSTMSPYSDSSRADMLRRMALENAIASGELEGIVYTPAMRELLERASRGLLTEAEFDREALAMARAGEG
jgi:hypothetical protein